MVSRRKALVAGAVIAGAGLSVLIGPALVQAAISDPRPVVRASLTIDGYEIASFSRCIGLGSESEVLADVPDEEVILRRLPGPVTGSTVCERSLTNGMELDAWREAVVFGDLAAARKSATLVMYDTEGDPQLRWHLEDAWPSGLTYLFDHDGQGRQVVTLTYDSIQRVAP